MKLEDESPHANRNDSRALSRRSLLTALGIVGSASFIGLDILDPEEAKADAWGGYSNGKIPTGALSPIPWASSNFLRADASSALVDLNKSFRTAFAKDLPISSAYRTYDEQVYWKDYWTKQNLPGNAAQPGFSNHGWALAIDIGVGIHDWTNPIYIWMKDNAGKYKWVHPAWAEPNGSTPEAWHWEFEGAYTASPPKQENGNEEMAVIISAATSKYNGIWLAAPGYWHMFTGEEWKQFNDHGLRSGIKDITAVNDRDFDVLKSIYTKQSGI